jgi:hypothetical protein
MNKTEPVISAKLIKKFFMQLPEGLYLVSNLYENELQSIFEEEISPSDLREQQWGRIVLAGAVQRLCRIFQNKGDYIAWLTQANFNSSKGKKQTAH